MILSKINKTILVISLLFFIQCYQDPFFDLTVKVIDQDSNPVSNLLIKIEITDLDNGSLIEDSIIGSYFEETTNDEGKVSFSFENKALVTARVCHQADQTLFCAEGHSYLEENKKKELKLMLQSIEVEHAQCVYCN
tara:strand:+ start:122 stop:529 length:408 start_codon:yes stop_codon:yes gene_type:complete